MMMEFPRKHNLRVLLFIAIMLVLFLPLLLLPNILKHLPKISAMPKSKLLPPNTRRPLIIYTKPRKTGSTFIASKLGVSIMHAGGKVAPCEISSLMTAKASYYGLVQGYDLLGCHHNMGKMSIAALARLGRDLVFVTSIRKPVGWFLSAAVWVYEKEMKEIVRDADILKKAVDYGLNGSRGEFGEFRYQFWQNYGLDGGESREDVRRVGNVFRYVIDHETAEEDVNEMLEELGIEAKGASLRREGVYEDSWWGGYRREDIERFVEFERVLYEEFGKIRLARRGKNVPWAKVGGDGSEVVYSAAGMVKKE